MPPCDVGFWSWLRRAYVHTLSATALSANGVIRAWAIARWRGVRKDAVNGKDGRNKRSRSAMMIVGMASIYPIRVVRRVTTPTSLVLTRNRNCQPCSTEVWARRRPKEMRPWGAISVMF